MKKIVFCLSIILFTFIFWREEMDTLGKHKTAVFGGGCFWCLEKPFRQIHGVTDVQVGYSGGKEDDAFYDKVSSGATEHLEVIQVTYDPQITPYESLVNVFWRNIDPTDSGGQFVDRGSHYTTAIFYHDEEQRIVAENSRKSLDQSRHFSAPIATEIRPAQTFYPAEEYHQAYYLKQPHHYDAYRVGSGRAGFIQATWSNKDYKKPSPKELRARLTDIQYKVTQKDGTERAYNNEYWDNKEEGIYVDIVSGEPLFSSTDKYDSHTGWPSFTKPLSAENVTLHEDKSLFSTRTEVRSAVADSHLGHVFRDGPAPTGYRFCINSAALEFIPADKLKSRGYSDYISLFGQKI